MEDVVSVLKKFKVLVLDADGVLFTGQESLYRNSQQETCLLKTRSLIDGQGISLMRAIGIKILFASGEGEPLSSVVEKFNNLPSTLSGEWEKVSFLQNLSGAEGKIPAISKWLEEHNSDWSDVVYIGDDLTDYQAMLQAAIGVAPANSTRKIKSIARILLKKEGGCGAIREFSELVLDARGIDETNLAIS